MYKSAIPIRKKGELPTSLPMGCTWATEWAARGLPMGILPCKLGSSVGSPLLTNIKKWAAQWAAELTTHGNFAMQIRLPTTSIYGNSGQLSGQSTTYKYEKVGSAVGSGVGCPWAAHRNFAMQIKLTTTSIYMYGYSWQFRGQLSGQPTSF